MNDETKRIKINRLSDGYLIIIRNKIQWASVTLNAILLLALIGWWIFFIVRYDHFFDDFLQKMVRFNFMPLIAIFFQIFIITILAQNLSWLLFGKEKILIKNGTLTAWVTGIIISRKWKHDINKIENLRVKPQKQTSESVGEFLFTILIRSLFLRGIHQKATEDSHLTFNYEGEPYVLGFDLTYSEACDFHQYLSVLLKAQGINI